MVSWAFFIVENSHLLLCVAEQLYEFLGFVAFEGEGGGDVFL